VVGVVGVGEVGVAGVVGVVGAGVVGAGVVGVPAPGFGPALGVEDVVGCVGAATGVLGVVPGDAAGRLGAGEPARAVLDGGLVKPSPDVVSDASPQATQATNINNVALRIKRSFSRYFERRMIRGRTRINARLLLINTPSSDVHRGGSAALATRWPPSRLAQPASERATLGPRTRLANLETCSKPTF
jgi:hypothetical protein